MSRRAYIYDIEVFPNLFMVTFRDVKTRVDTTFWIYDIKGVGSRNDMIELTKFIKNHILIGFNNVFYDNPMLNYIYSNIYILYNYPVKTINRLIYQESKKTIEGSREWSRKLPFRSCDLMALGTIKCSLKHVGVLLKHEWLQELPYRFDYAIKTQEEVDMVLKYNINDIDITEKLYYKLRPEVMNRIKAENKKGVEALDVTRSQLGNKLTIQMYEDVTGKSKNEFLGLRTYRDRVAFKDCISPIIKYKTSKMQKFLQEVKLISVDTRGGKKPDFSKIIVIGDTTYTMGMGGLHDAMKDTVIKRDPDYFMRDADVGSYYPRIIQHFDCFPEHIDHRVKSRYVEMIDERIALKKTDPTEADMLKIVLNAFYGKYGSQDFFLYDPKAMYSVTLNGQLSLLMLIEDLELAGIKVFSANTDGIIAYFHKDLEEKYNEICNNWERTTKLDLEYADYDEVYMLDCNNYMVIKDRKLYKEKGSFFTGFDPMRSFNQPIVFIAIKEYFLNKKPVRQTIEEHKDILDFTACQNSDKKYHYLYRYIDNNQELTQNKIEHAVRYYASKGGGLLVKTTGLPDAKTEKVKETSMIAKQNVSIINDLEDPFPKKNPIDYDYYTKKSMTIIERLLNPVDSNKRNKQKIKTTKNQLKLL
jgi:DNA polymerase elongation subunit (family B)